jgi:hypothetical protein
MINVLDFETFKEKEVVIPYCLCILFKNETKSFYLNSKTNFDNNENINNFSNNTDETNDIFINFLNFIVNNLKENKVEFYIHNLDFDGFLIISSLTKFLINFKIYSEKRKIFMIRVDYCGKMIYFKCSYKIIPLSLNYLGNMENFKKKFFPYKFVNSNNINYVGPVPNKEFWNENNYEDFIINKEKKYIYDLKKETIEYCINDVLLTERVLKNLFLIIDEESVSIRKKSLSAPSMSYHIFLKKYNNFSALPNLKLDEDSYVRNSYFGGRCEVFGNIYNNEHIKYFDFSGMYGQCMLENFHCGQPKFYEANNFNMPGFYNIDFFSNFYDFPILPSHYDNKLMFTNGRKNGTF